MLESEVFIRELLSIDALPSRSIAASEITRLQHEVRNDAVEDAALVVQRLARTTDTLWEATQGK
jgi:hypothetical protein